MGDDDRNRPQDHDRTADRRPDRHPTRRPCGRRARRTAQSEAARSLPDPAARWLDGRRHGCSPRLTPRRRRHHRRRRGAQRHLGDRRQSLHELHGPRQGGRRARPLPPRPRRGHDRGRARDVVAPPRPGHHPPGPRHDGGRLRHRRGLPRRPPAGDRRPGDRTDLGVRTSAGAVVDSPAGTTDDASGDGTLADKGAVDTTPTAPTTPTAATTAPTAPRRARPRPRGHRPRRPPRRRPPPASDRVDRTGHAHDPRRTGPGHGHPERSRHRS